MHSFYQKLNFDQQQIGELSYLDLLDYGQVLSVHFSPYEWSQNILLVACENTIIVVRIEYGESLEFEKVAAISHLNPCTSLAISPDANISVLPINMHFCTASDDFSLRVYKGNLSENDKDSNDMFQQMVGHTNFINDLSYNPENNCLATVSDDQTARIWNTDTCEMLSKLILTSPGVSVGWHRENDKKLMVAEKAGIIRLYNVETLRPIMSFIYEKPLFSAHWAPSDIRIFGSLQMGELLLWDMSRPSCPLNQNLLYTEMGGHIKFSPLGELVASVNPLEGQLKVIHVQTQQERLTAKVQQASTNISWHYKLPIMCLGQNSKVCFWKIISK